MLARFTTWLTTPQPRLAPLRPHLGRLRLIARGHSGWGYFVNWLGRRIEIRVLRRAAR